MFPIQIDYNSSMAVAMLLLVVLSIIAEEDTRPDERLKGFWKKVGVMCVVAFVACVAHGIVFWTFSGMGVIKCSNYHPSGYAHTGQMSSDERNQFFKNNGLNELGYPDR